MRVCLKELREVHVWLRLLDRLEVLDSQALEAPGKECNELIAIFTKSVLTATRGVRTPNVKLLQESEIRNQQSGIAVAVTE